MTATMSHLNKLLLGVAVVALSARSFAQLGAPAADWRGALAIEYLTGQWCSMFDPSIERYTFIDSTRPHDFKAGGLCSTPI